MPSNDYQRKKKHKQKIQILHLKQRKEFKFVSTRITEPLYPIMSVQQHMLKLDFIDIQSSYSKQKLQMMEF